MYLQPVILSGGSGTRLWPLSRERYPKQFLALVTDKTLFQDTVRRLDGLQDGALGDSALLPPMVVCNEVHRFLVAEQLREIDSPHAGILLEPVGRNTAPALTLAALHAIRTGQDPVLLVMPADHVIQDTAAFHQAVHAAVALAEQNYLITFGIVPTAPETGYGYIRPGEPIVELPFSTSPLMPHVIGAFTEKPDAATAQAYIDSGAYFWNSGLFVMKASHWLDAIRHFRPELSEACENSYREGRADADFYRIDKAAFAQCPSDSIDYAVMEKLGKSSEPNVPCGALVPLDAGWSDVGAWSALWTVRDKDSDGNALHGDVRTHNARNNLIHAHSRLVTVIGVEDLTIIETSDAVLISRRDQVPDVKAIVAQLKIEQRGEYLNHRCVHRPWGSYETIDLGQRHQVKRITVKPGASLSLQMHHHRAEHWVVVTGTAKVTRGEETFLISENQSTYIPLGTRHRLENPGKFPLEMIEIQSGSYLGEDDIIRFEDVYGR